MPKFSVIYLSYRPGSYDILADSLSHQICTDYELICVDEMTSRHQLVADYLLSHNVKLSKISASKPKCFPELPNSSINAMNTGLFLSTGKYIVILHDYIWLPPDALSKFERLDFILNEGGAIHGVGVCLEDNRPRHLDKPISIWDKDWVGNPVENGCKIRSLWRPHKFEMFYCVIPYFILEFLNGFPEYQDAPFAGIDIVNWFMNSMEAIRRFYTVDDRNVCYLWSHKDWGEELWSAGKRENARVNTFDLRNHVRGTL